MTASPSAEGVGLRPALLADRGQVHAWLVKAYESPFFCDEQRPPAWEEFLTDYEELFFTDHSPRQGRVFIITQDGADIGAVSYDARYHGPGRADVDIWLAGEALCGHGRGGAALGLLLPYLRGRIGLSHALMSPCARNLRAVRCYEKAGFKPLDLPRRELESRYGPLDCPHALVMERPL